MEFLMSSPLPEKDRYGCVYCNQEYPSEKELAIHEYIHGSYIREAIFNLTIQPRNNYLVYEEFNYECGKMRSGNLFKELGCAETPEQDQTGEKTPNKKEFDTSVSSLSPHTPTHGKQVLDRPLDQLAHRSLQQQLDIVSHDSQYDYNRPREDQLAYKERAYRPSNGQLGFKPGLELDNFDYRSLGDRRTAGFARKTFDVFHPTDDSEILNSLAADILKKYETFPLKNGLKQRDEWEDMYDAVRAGNSYYGSGIALDTFVLQDELSF